MWTVLIKFTMGRDDLWRKSVAAVLLLLRSHRLTAIASAAGGAGALRAKASAIYHRTKRDGVDPPAASDS